jgi:hypothetical protein
MRNRLFAHPKTSIYRQSPGITYALPSPAVHIHEDDLFSIFWLRPTFHQRQYSSTQVPYCSSGGLIDRQRFSDYRPHRHPGLMDENGTRKIISISGGGYEVPSSYRGHIPPLKENIP